MRFEAGIGLLVLVSAFGATPEQLHFSAEDEKVERPINIPEGVAAILRNDKDVRASLNDEPPSATDQLPPSWFSASVVHLDGAGEKDIVVMATGTLTGANVTTFWVFRATNRGYELAFKAYAHDLIVTNKRWKGYRIIETDSMTAVLIRTARYRLEGGQYTVFRDTSWKDIN